MRARITIFEGPDGSGKTTAAKKYAEETGARYVHLGPFTGVRKNLSRFFVEAMLPALLGYQDVVMDRSWLSEAPYAKAFRNGDDRVGYGRARALDRLALRCAATVVWCDPGFDQVVKCYKSRRDTEMLDNEAQLREVYELYREVRTSGTSLPGTVYDYTSGPPVFHSFGTRENSHPVNLYSAGAWDAKIIIVCDRPTDFWAGDSLYQWPLGDTCQASDWVNDLLGDCNRISEKDLLWVGCDESLTSIAWAGTSFVDRKIIALGARAMGYVRAAGLLAVEAEDPVSALMSMHESREEYDLITLIRRFKNGR